jgi:PAS domain S-box-containing protein
MNILIVDDHPTNLKLLRAQLEAEGHAVFEAHDGVDALALLERQRVDVVISDILMPCMDGYRFCHEIRKHARLHDLPVIIYTFTFTSSGDEKLALDVGADKYLKKPASVETIIAALHEVTAMPHAAPRPEALQEVEVLKEYSERLVSKLKEKNIGLEQADAERSASEERFRQLAEHVDEVFWMTDVAKNEMIYISPAYEVVWGLTCASLYASPRAWLDAIHPEDRERIVQSAFTNQATGTYDEEYRIVQPDGAIRWIHDRAFPVRNQTGEVYRIAGVAQDITERKQSEQALRVSEARYRTLAETAQDIIYVIDREFRMTYINEYGARQFGRSLPEMIGRHLTELFPAETTQWQLADMAGVFRTGESLYRERQLSTGQRLMWLDNRLVPVKNATGEVESILGISRDITEHKQVEGQRLRTQRLESIGTLAGGVAHDLNNALAPILMATELLRLEFPDTAASYLDLIQAGAKRGADMVKQLLTFAKGVEGDRLLVQPKHLLKEMEKLIGSTFPKNIELRTRYAKDLRTILGDATQLHQVLLNLCVNARDAMPEGGTLTLEAENMELETVYADAITEAKPGHYVVWRVMDTGTGIPPEIQDRIFDPFFTTKGPGKGTGLGLSTIIGIAKSHGGFVRVYSVPGKGSTFAVYLPAYGSDADDTTLLTETDMTFRGHGETILVVDDEAAVRNVLRAVLTKLNFKVLTASDGTAALVQVTEQPAELHAVITDLHMPHMDGLSFVRVLKGRLPQVGIIVVSGRLDEREENEFKKLGVSALLDKPFSQKELLEALKTVFQK